MNKKTISSIIASAALAIAGCTETYTTEEMTKLGNQCGITAAYVMNNQVKVDDIARNTIIDVMNEVEKYIPQTNATYVATWMPIVYSYVQQCVKDGNITQDIADRVVDDAGKLFSLLDAYVQKKDIYGHKDLTDAFIHAFFGGFLTNFKPANSMSGSNNQNAELDSFTAEYLISVMK